MIILLVLPATTRAVPYTWTPTGAGTYSWNDASSQWTSGFPSLADDIANLNINLAGNQIINLNQAITVGTLNLGDTGSTYYTTTIAANGGSLILDVATGDATIAKAATGNDKTDTISAGIQLNDNLAINNAATADAGALTISGIISESGGAKVVTLAGPGMVALNNANNSFTGGVTVNGGSMNPGSDRSLGIGGTLTLNNGTVYTGLANFVLTHPVVLVNSGTFRLYQGFTVSANITGSGGLAVTGGSALLALSGINSYSGGTTITGGNIALSGAGQLDSAGTISIASGKQFQFTSSFAQVLNGTISGAGNILISTGGTLTLNGNNTFSGGVQINAGTVKAGSNTALGTGALNNNAAAGKLIAGADGLSLSNSVVLASSGQTLTVDTAGNSLTLSGVISGSGKLTKSGSGMLTLCNMNTYVGATTLSSGAISLGDGTSGHDGSVASGIANNGTLIYNLYGNKTVGYVISGAGALTKAGGGTVTLAGVQTYAGTTTVSNGTLLVSGSITSAVTVVSGAAFGGTGTISNNVTLLSNTQAIFTQGAPMTITGSLTLSNNTVRVNLPGPLELGMLYPLATYNPTGSVGSFAKAAVIESGNAAGVPTIVIDNGTVYLRMIQQGMILSIE